MRTRVYNNKEQIFCEWRKRWVRLTPEEWVRQQLLHRLVEQLEYPMSLIAVEVPFTMANGKAFRADAVVYGNATLPRAEGQGGVSPLMLIECKAETVPLTQKTLDQALTYNRKLGVPWLVLHNGIQTISVKTGDNIAFSSEIPAYNQMTQW